MTDTQLTLIIGFASTILTPIITNYFAAKKADQALAARALELKAETQDVAAKLELKTEEAARNVIARTSQDHDTIARKLEQQNVVMRQQSSELRENTRLTEVGNDIKSDIRTNQAAIAQLTQAVIPSEQLDRIESTGSNTNETVHKIKTDGTDPARDFLIPTSEPKNTK